MFRKQTNKNARKAVELHLLTQPWEAEIQKCFLMFAHLPPVFHLQKMMKIIWHHERVGKQNTILVHQQTTIYIYNCFIVYFAGVGSDVICVYVQPSWPWTCDFPVLCPEYWNFMYVPLHLYLWFGFFPPSVSLKDGNGLGLESWGSFMKM